MALTWCLKNRPTGVPALSDFELRETALPTLNHGMIRVRNNFLSVDPYMRLRMNLGKSYIEPFDLGAPMDGGAVGTVIESRSPLFKEGDRALHFHGWRDEAIAPAEQFEKLPDLPVSDHLFLGILGMPGMTSYFGFFDVAQPKAGETMFVSAAAGAVGSTVVQLGKIQGLKVIGSAGGENKCALVKSLGADAVIDYKTDGSLVDKLAAAAPKGIDVYYDNVGGDHLDAALANAADGGRFAMCGMIANYDEAAPEVMRHLMNIVRWRLTLRGFICTRYADRTSEFRDRMTGWVIDGKLRSIDTIREGLENTPAALLELFGGANTGKMVVKLG